MANSDMKKPELTGIHHLKFPVKSIKASHDFYTQVLPLDPLPQYTHRNAENGIFAMAVGRKFPYGDNVLIELRYDPKAAGVKNGWDDLTYGVRKQKDLEQWGKWFDLHGVEHSKVFFARKGWCLRAMDPDGRQVSLYVTEEEHEWTDDPDEDEFWLGGAPKADPNI